MTHTTAVVVTRDRRELLLRCLAALDTQNRRPDRVVVVDNASQDGSSAAVRTAFPDIDLVRLEQNTGGAGGFAYGLAAALAAGTDCVWALDDDTIPRPGALAALLGARKRYPSGVPSVVASRVLWTDNRAHPMNTPRTKPACGPRERAAASAVGCLPIRSASFVSVLLDAGRCREVGLPIADYFLWNDDFEYTTRLLRGGRGLLCPASVVVHETAAPLGSDRDPGARFFYEVRNKIWALTRSPALRPASARSTARRRCGGGRGRC